MRTRAFSVHVLVFDEVDLLDVTGILHVLSEAGRHYNFRPYRVTLVGEAGRRVPTRAQTSLLCEPLPPSDKASEILVIPGGYGARRALDNPVILSWVAANAPRAEWSLAIGEGLLLLAKATALGSAKAVASEDVARLLMDLAPEVVLEPGASVCFDGKLGTAKLSAHALDLALELVSATLGESFALRTAWAMGHRWAPLKAAVLRADPALELISERKPRSGEQR
ncbi:MAG: DJ-1/PfpI family protein [Polyangiaceae bacterium]|nr:DJ-1/PfpI family protein [Polyangiaceae bacterium]